MKYLFFLFSLFFISCSNTHTSFWLHCSEMEGTYPVHKIDYSNNGTRVTVFFKNSSCEVLKVEEGGNKGGME